MTSYIPRWLSVALALPLVDCLESRQLRGLSVHSGAEREQHSDDAQGCEANLTTGTKLMLMPIVPMYHGSTALESLFMSSNAITTLCGAKTWQCEARLDFDGKPLCIRENLLPRYTQYWNMSKPVLFEKGPRGMHDKVVREYDTLLKEHKVHAEMLKKKGLVNLRLAYVLMWRPICLSYASRHATREIDANATKYAMDELLWLEDLVKSHKFLEARNVSIMVTNMGDMLWRAERTKARLEKFLPCVGELDFDYVPKLNQDIFPANDWKAEGSVHAFASSLEPRTFGYDVKKGECFGEGNLFLHLHKNDLMRARTAMHYLENLSRL